MAELVTIPVELTIDDEFARVADPLDRQELANLERQLLRDGCRDAVCYWTPPGEPSVHLIIDGHNRYAICRKHGIAYPTHEVVLPSREHVVVWIAETQMARRNVSPGRKFYYMGKMGLLAALDRAKNKPVTVLPVLGKRGGNIAESVAAKMGTTERTVHRASRFASAADRLPAKLREAAFDGTLTRPRVHELSGMPKETLRALAEVPVHQLRSATAAAISAHREATVISTRPIVHIKALHALAASAGALSKARSAALEACNGEGWASGHAEKIRVSLVAIHEEVLLWQREAEARQKVA